MDPDELADELQREYDRCKMFPEYQPSGRIALIELRNLVPRAIDLLRRWGGGSADREQAPTLMVVVVDWK